MFAYGSLMWNPGFAFVERREAVLEGYHRDFCVLSVRHRGTPEQPGLVLGLADGGSTRGFVYRVASRRWPETYAYLLLREQPTRAYGERICPVRLDDGRVVEALAFVADPGHPQWAGRLTLPQRAALIRSGWGASGANLDYLRDLAAALARLGLSDPALAALQTAAEGADDDAGDVAGADFSAPANLSTIQSRI